MDKNGVKTNILWAKYCEWQFGKYWKTYFIFNRQKYAFKPRIRISFRAPGTAVKLLKTSRDS
jgi:hypothetical protein